MPEAVQLYLRGIVINVRVVEPAELVFRTGPSEAKTVAVQTSSKELNMAAAKADDEPEAVFGDRKSIS